MRKSLANEMILRFPKAPLATLIWILRSGRIPTDIEIGFILEMIAEIFVVNNVSQEMDDLTMTESLDESIDEMSSECELNPNKRKQKFAGKNTHPAGKKFKRNNEAGISKSQSDPTFLYGKRFENKIGNNICYINFVLNGLLALDKYREKLNEGSCHCDLCIFLARTNLDAIDLRIWASLYNPVFSVHRRQEDAEEFLMILIEKCANLSNLAHFDTKEKHACTVCRKVRYVS